MPSKLLKTHQKYKNYLNKYWITVILDPHYTGSKVEGMICFYYLETMTSNMTKSTGRFHIWFPRNGEKNFNSPKLDIFMFQFLIHFMLFGSPGRLKWCIKIVVLFNRSWSFSDFSCWKKKSKGHFLGDMVCPIKFWLR